MSPWVRESVSELGWGNIEVDFIEDDQLKNRIQRPKESVAYYVASKTSLILEAFQHHGLPYIILQESLMEGLRDDSIRRAIQRENPQSMEESADACLKGVSDNAVLWSMGCQGIDDPNQSAGRVSRELDEPDDSVG